MVFIAGWIMQVVIIFGYPYTPDYYGDVVVGSVLFTLLPWYALLLLAFVQLFCLSPAFCFLSPDPFCLSPGPFAFAFHLAPTSAHKP